jgi:hypothetical protein
MRTELADDRITPHLTSFLCGATIPFLHNRPILLNWRDTCISWNNAICVISRSVLHIVSLWKFSYLLKGIHPLCQCSEVEESFTLCQTALCSWIKETHVFPGTIPSVLEAVGSCTLLHYENWVSLWKEYSLLTSISKMEKHSLCSK